MTSKIKNLRNPPIVEALVELRAAFSSPLVPSSLDAFCEAERPRYPDQQRQFEFAAHVDFNPAGSGAMVSQPNHVGFVLKSEPLRTVVQARLDGLRVSWLSPYKDWSSLLTETKRLWKSYRQHTDPDNVTRVGVRYINRFRLSLPANLKDYLKTGPEIAPSLEQSVAEFFFRLVSLTGANSRVVLTEFSEPTGVSDELGIVLDIDATESAPWTPSSPEIWKALERLHETKNNYFFNSVSPKLLAKFE